MNGDQNSNGGTRDGFLPQITNSSKSKTSRKGMMVNNDSQQKMKSASKLTEQRLG